MTRTLHGVDHRIQHHMKNLRNGSILRMLQSPDPLKQHVAAVCCRYMLALERPLIREVTSAGLLPGLVRLLSSTDPKLAHEAAWALCNFAMGSAHDTRVLVDHDALPPLIELLRLPNSLMSYRLAVVAAQALGNIAHDHRDVILNNNVLSRLLELISHCIDTSHRHLIVAELIRVCSSTLCKLCTENPRPPWFVVSRALPTLVLLLTATDEIVLRNACSALESFFAPLRGDFSDDASLLSALHAGALSSRLVELSVHPNQEISIPVLRTLLHASRQNLDAVVALGVMHTLPQSLATPFAPRIFAVRILGSICAQDVQRVLDAGLMHTLCAIPLTDVDPYLAFFVAEALYDAAYLATGQQTHALVAAGCLSTITHTLHYCTYPRFDKYALQIVHFSLTTLELILRQGQPLDEPTNAFADELVRLDAATHVEFYITDQPKHIADRAMLLSSLYLHPMPHPVFEPVVEQSCYNGVEQSCYNGLPLFDLV